METWLPMGISMGWNEPCAEISKIALVALVFRQPFAIWGGM